MTNLKLKLKIAKIRIASQKQTINNLKTQLKVQVKIIKIQKKGLL